MNAAAPVECQAHIFSDLLLFLRETRVAGDVCAEPVEAVVTLTFGGVQQTGYQITLLVELCGGHAQLAQLDRRFVAVSPVAYWPAT